MSKLDQRDRQRYEALKRELGEIGFVRRGSLVRRLTTCGKAGCACQADPPRLHGPYYQWTRKVKAKTITVRVPKRQVRLFEEWIANARTLDRLTAEMERISNRITDRVLNDPRNS